MCVCVCVCVCVNLRHLHFYVKFKICVNKQTKVLFKNKSVGDEKSRLSTQF